jgi:hypothetical protein
LRRTIEITGDNAALSTVSSQMSSSILEATRSPHWHEGMMALALPVQSHTLSYQYDEIGSKQCLFEGKNAEKRPKSLKMSMHLFGLPLGVPIV